jgi:hypothetical protein
MNYRRILKLYKTQEQLLENEGDYILNELLFITEMVPAEFHEIKYLNT